MPPHVGASLTLGGEERLLRYTAPTLARVQRELGGEALGETVREISRVSVRHIAAMVWGGLLHEKADTKIEDVLELIEPPLDDAVKAIMGALRPWIVVQRATDSGDPAPRSEKKSGATTT